MRSVLRRPGFPALGLVLALVAGTTVVPAAGAQSQLHVRSVGEIFVSAAGQASGQNLATAIDEARGVLGAYTAVALGAEVFSSVAIEDFTQAEKIHGVGSSSIVLRGSNAVVSLYDDINSEFRVQATSPTTVHYALGAKSFAQAAGPHLANVFSANGEFLGSLVAVGADGAASHADAIAVANGEARATLSAGAQVVWTARPVYATSLAHHEAVVEALESGLLASKVVTEFEGSSQAQSKVDYFGDVQSSTRATADHAIESDVKSRSETAAVLAYDLAYESLPARSASEVAVYVDGEIAARADSAAAVADHAEAGLASFYATIENGRSLVLASTPSFRSSSSHRVTIVAEAHASSEAQARADSRAESDSRAVGEYSLHANGKLTGVFTTGIIDAQAMTLHDYTSLGSRTEIFDSVQLEGSARGTNVEGRSVTLTGPKADLTVVDDLYASLVVEARESSAVVLDLGPDVKATLDSTNVARLHGPSGYVGAVILASGSARARAPSAPSAPSPPPPALSAPSDGQLRASLASEYRLIFRAGGDTEHASESAIVHAIAAGLVGAQVIAGLEGSAASTHEIAYSKNVNVDVTGASRGLYTIRYEPRVDAPRALVFDARGTAIAAKAASDVRVLVDGKLAGAVHTPQLALASAGEPRYYVDSSVAGQLRVLVSTASAFGSASTVTIESLVEKRAKASAGTDGFGVFDVRPDGTAVGSFVSVRADQQAGVVNDFTMLSTGQTVFESIRAGASGFASVGSAGTPRLALENREAKIELVDTTNAYMRIVAEKATTANFDLAPDLRAEERSDAVIEITTSSGDSLGSMIITDAEGRASAASSFEHSSEDRVHATLAEGSQVIFRTHVGIEAELSAAQRTMINHAIAGGRVAGQVLVQSQASLSASAAMAAAALASSASRLESTAVTSGDASATAISAIEAQGQVTTAITASYFEDVQMVTAATKERVDVTVSSTTSAGKTVIISLDPATLPQMSTGDAEIVVTGRAAAQASSYADVLNPNDDNGVHEYFVLAGEAGTQVLVSIPHFSTQTVTLKPRDASAPPVFMYATIFLGLLVVAETALLVRRRSA